jgi:hypothetical protein
MALFRPSRMFGAELPGATKASSVVRRTGVPAVVHTLRFVEIRGELENADLVLRLGRSLPIAVDVGKNFTQPVRELPKVHYIKDNGSNQGMEPIIEL